MPSRSSKQKINKRRRTAKKEKNSDDSYSPSSLSSSDSVIELSIDKEPSSSKTKIIENNNLDKSNVHSDLINIKSEDFEEQNLLEIKKNHECISFLKKYMPLCSVAYCLPQIEDDYPFFLAYRSGKNFHHFFRRAIAIFAESRDLIPEALIKLNKISKTNGWNAVYLIILDGYVCFYRKYSKPYELGLLNSNSKLVNVNLCPTYPDKMIEKRFKYMKRNNELDVNNISGIAILRDIYIKPYAYLVSIKEREDSIQRVLNFLDINGIRRQEA